MFSGIVEEVGRVAAAEPDQGGLRLGIEASGVLEGTRVGDSIAVSGCCLTVVALEPGRFAVQAVPETLARTTLGTARPGDRVNLERALRADQRLGGHFVMGHVDGIAEVLECASQGNGRRLAFSVPEPLAPLVAEKGSVALDGISLTVAAVRGATAEVALVPFTLERTTAGGWVRGSRVNLEADLLARYLARLLQTSAPARGAAGRDAWA